MKIKNGADQSDAKIRAHLSGMDDGNILEQSLVQQGAIHAIGTLLMVGVTEDYAKCMLRDLEHFGTLLDAECKRRNLPTV